VKAHFFYVLPLSVGKKTAVLSAAACTVATTSLQLIYDAEPKTAVSAAS
jgi:hypothetical protein